MYCEWKCPGGGNSHMKVTGMLIVSLRGVNCRFWSDLGCSGRKANIFTRTGIASGRLWTKTREKYWMFKTYVSSPNVESALPFLSHFFTDMLLIPLEIKSPRDSLRKARESAFIAMLWTNVMECYQVIYLSIYLILEFRYWCSHMVFSIRNGQNRLFNQLRSKLARCTLFAAPYRTFETSSISQLKTRS